MDAAWAVPGGLVSSWTLDCKGKSTHPVDETFEGLLKAIEKHEKEFS